jgi:signal transduction histidine kinase
MSSASPASTEIISTLRNDPEGARARDQVFALLSHEIRTPLNGVLGMAGLLASTSLDATQSAYLATLRDCGEHLLGLVNDMLDLAKLESGRVELEPVKTDVESLLQGVCELLSPRAYAQGVEIAWAVGADVPPIRTDDGRLRQILFNLAGNAVKLTREGGVLLSAVRVSAPDEPLRLRFTVKDSGPGLRPEEQTRIFEEFVQAEAGPGVLHREA